MKLNNKQRSILSIYRVLSRFLHLDKPFDEKVGNAVESYREKLEEKKEKEEDIKTKEEEKV